MMGLFDFDIHDATPEKKKLYEISENNGQTWEKCMLTPSEAFALKYAKYAVRSYYSEYSILYYPGGSSTPIKMTIPVPVDRDAKEYIDEFLDGILNDFLRYNSEWEFD